MRNTHEDFERHLAEQLELLETAADLYDQGKEIQAKTISAHLRTLLHDKGRAVSILQHLGIKENLQFCDTRIGRPSANDLPEKENVFIVGAYCGLVAIAITKKTTPMLMPMLGQHKQKICFHDWWHAIVMSDESGNVNITREDVVLSLAEKDGGVHVDLKLNEQYAMFSRNNALGIGEIRNNVWTSNKNPEYAVVRQIAHEVLLTLKNGYSKELCIEDGILINPIGLGLRVASDKSESNEVKQNLVKKIGRNQSCPCGSGKKHKKCCGCRD